MAAILTAHYSLSFKGKKWQYFMLGPEAIIWGFIMLKLIIRRYILMNSYKKLHSRYHIIYKKETLSNGEMDLTKDSFFFFFHQNKTSLLNI